MSTLSKPPTDTAEERVMCGGMPLATLAEWYLEESDRVVESFEGDRAPVNKRDGLAD